MKFTGILMVNPNGTLYELKFTFYFHHRLGTLILLNSYPLYTFCFNGNYLFKMILTILITWEKWIGN